MRDRLRNIQMHPIAPLLTAGLFAVLIIGLVLLIDRYAPGTVPLDPAMEAPRFLPSVDLLILETVLVTAWGISVDHRCTDAVVRRDLFHIVMLISLWLVLAIGKYVVVSSFAKALFWYAQCLPLLLNPLFFLFCALRMAGLDSRPGVIALKVVLTSVAIGLFMLVATNNHHHLVFVFDMEDPDWEYNFTFGPGYYACLALMMASMIASTILLGIASHNKIRKRIIWLVVLACIGTAYTIIVTTKSGAHLPGTNALAGSVLYIAAIEFCLDLGFFPTAHHYSALFRNLPFDLKIITPSGAVAYRTIVSKSLDSESIARLTALLPTNDHESTITVRNETTPGYIFKLYRLSAGIALLTEDTSEIDQLQASLEEQQRILANQNEVLDRTQSMQGLLFRQQRERVLEERVGRGLEAAARQIETILDSLASGTNTDLQESRMEQLTLVKVLVAYCKRKGMLALAAAESDMMAGEQLNLIIQEAMADLRSVGLECAALVTVSEPIPIAAVDTVYDSFYDCIIAVLSQTDPVVMTSISINSRGELELRVTIECAIGIDSKTAVEQIPTIATSTESWTAVQTRIANELEKRLSTRDCDSSVSLEDGLVVAVVQAASIPLCEWEVLP